MGTVEPLEPESMNGAYPFQSGSYTEPRLSAGGQDVARVKLTETAVKNLTFEKREREARETRGGGRETAGEGETAKTARRMG